MQSYIDPRGAMEELVLEEIQSILRLLGTTHSEHFAISIKITQIGPPGGLML